MKTDVDIWIDEFFETGRDALLFMIKDDLSLATIEQQDIVYGLEAHFEAGYCWHFAHMLKTVFERGEVCWAAPFSHFCFVDNDGQAYDGGGRYMGEALYMIPERYCGKFIDAFKHIKGMSIVEATKKELISIIQRYCEDEALTYNPRLEQYIQE